VVAQEPQLGERPLVEEEVQTLADRELSCGVLLLDPLRPAHPQSLVTLPAEDL
jgi:hypothetical protein